MTNRLKGYSQFTVDSNYRRINNDLSQVRKIDPQKSTHTLGI